MYGISCRFARANHLHTHKRSVLHACQSIPIALRDGVFLLHGRTVKPESGIGTNAQRNTKASCPKPGGITVGPGFSGAEIGQMRAVSDLIKPMAWISAEPKNFDAIPTPEEMAEKVKACLTENTVVAGSEIQWLTPGYYPF
jgi:hypothetical protein